MSGRSREIIPNVVRTITQSVTAVSAVVDLDNLESSDDVRSITIVPPAANAVEFRGTENDDPFVIPEDGFVFNINFSKGKTSALPFLRAVGATVEVTLLVAVERKF